MDGFSKRQRNYLSLLHVTHLLTLLLYQIWKQSTEEKKVIYNFEKKVNQMVNLGRRQTSARPPARPVIFILKSRFKKNVQKYRSHVKDAYLQRYTQRSNISQTDMTPANTQRRYVAATSWRCSDCVTTLLLHCVVARTVCSRARNKGNVNMEKIKWPTTSENIPSDMRNIRRRNSSSASALSANAHFMWHWA